MSLVMCASMAASAFLFIGTSKKDAEWIAEHGDPDEYEKKMKQLEKKRRSVRRRRRRRQRQRRSLRRCRNILLWTPRARLRKPWMRILR